MLLDRLLLTIVILLYAAGVPWLELNDTHVFNPAWVAHARLHEVWQLVTNSAFGLLSLWLVWHRGALRGPAIIALLITGGFFVAYLLRDSYGGSMLHSDGSERLLFGINIGVLGFGVALLMIATVLWRNRSSAAG